MSYDELLHRFAPCGLDCSRCFAREGGAVQTPALQLQRALAGFEALAQRMAERTPDLGSYPQFQAVLAVFSGASCPGCRASGGHLRTCAARTCYKDKGVDFCFQCEEYPCERNNYHGSLHDRWRRYNDRMQEVGVEQFAAEQAVEPRFE
jgi:hypothetical protein